jgi:acid phosphatase type 7
MTHRTCVRLTCNLFIITLLSFSNVSHPTQLHAQQPERIILNLTIQPATSMAVTWRTAEQCDSALAEIAISIAQPNLNDTARQYKATSEWVSIAPNKNVQSHSVVFTELQPNTLYAYRVGDGQRWSEWNQFRTASVQPEPFQFINFGDPQTDIFSLCSRVFRSAYSKAPNARFWQFTGDIVDRETDELWGELYAAFGWISQVTPMILVPGNHGYLKADVDGKTVRQLTPFWRPQFTLPENGPKGLEESAYFLDYQGVRFIMLNGTEKIEQQAAWLDSILVNNPNRWTISAMHQPVYSTVKKRDNVDAIKLLAPMYDKYHVDLVLQGHDHTYCRSGKVYAGKLVGDDDQGTVYVVSVSGTKIYDYDSNYNGMMKKTGSGRQLFQVISVTNDKLSYESWTVNGELFDQFVLIK